MAEVGDKAFKCFQCDKTFHQQNQLIVHMRKHTGERPFDCRYCLKSFTSKNVLTVHERIHTGERPYKCPHCEKRFLAYSHLVVHRLIHTNSKPYVCRLCCRGFRHSGNLSRHFKTHLISTGFRCIYCRKIFSTENDLLKHSKVDHPCKYTETSLLSGNMKTILGFNDSTLNSDGNYLLKTNHMSINKLKHKKIQKNSKKLNTKATRVNRPKSTTKDFELAGEKDILDTSHSFNKNSRYSEKNVIEVTDSFQHGYNVQTSYNIAPKTRLECKIKEDHLLEHNYYLNNHKSNLSDILSKNIKISSKKHSINAIKAEFSDSIVQDTKKPLNCSAYYHSPVPPPLIPIEEIDKSYDYTTKGTSLDHSKRRNHNFHKNVSILTNLREPIKESDLKSEPLKSEIDENCMLQQRYAETLEQSVYENEDFMNKVNRSLRNLVGIDIMNHLGFPERTCEQILITILEMAKKNYCIDARINKIERMKNNMKSLVELSFPEKSIWETLGWAGKPIELILDQIESKENLSRITKTMEPELSLY